MADRTAANDVDEVGTFSFSIGLPSMLKEEEEEDRSISFSLSNRRISAWPKNERKHITVIRCCLFGLCVFFAVNSLYAIYRFFVSEGKIRNIRKIHVPRISHFSLQNRHNCIKNVIIL